MLIFCSPLWADTHTFTSAGVNNLWSNAANWPGGPPPGQGVPVDTDAFIIPNGQTCEFDADLSLWAGLAASTIAQGGTLRACETAGAYVLKTTGDLTVAGTLQAGTSVAVPYPSTCTFTINFSGTAKSIERGANGSIKLYCTQPTNKYLTMTEQAGIGETDITVTEDVTADGPWSIVGAQVRLIDSTPLDSDLDTIASLAVDHIHLTAGPASAIESGGLIILLTRNIRIINVASADYAITYANNSSAGTAGADHVACEINNCYRGIYYGYGLEFAGTAELLTSSPLVFNSFNAVTFSGAVAGPSSGSGTVFNACNGVVAASGSLCAGFTKASDTSSQNQYSGLIFGCSYGTSTDISPVLTTTGQIAQCTYGMNAVLGAIIYGSMTNNGRHFFGGGKIVLANTSLTGSTTGDLDGVDSGVAYNTHFDGGTEFANYASSKRGAASYFESFNHDQQVNAFKGWCKGGIVTSDDTPASQPPGYTIFYDHECESATYPCFRQYAATVQPGTAIEVAAVIRNTDGIDVSSTSPIDLRPRLEIVDVFADWLVDSTQTALASDAIATSDGSDADWQDVSVIWANQGDAPRQVYVRIICYSHDASTHTIDEAWSVASYQDQINTILNIIRPVNTDVATANTASSFTLTAGEATADAYKNMTVFVQDADDDHWELRSISAWTAGRVITVSSAFSFTPGVGDLAYILGTSYGAPVDLTAITDKLPSKPYLAGSENSTGDIEMDGATGNYSGSVGSVAGAVGSVTGAVASVAAPVTVGTNNDKTDYALSDAGVTAVQSGLATATNVSDAESNIREDTEDLQTQVGTAGAGLTAIGDARLANLDAAVSTRLSSAGYTAPDNAGIASIQAKTDNLPASPAAVGSAMTLTSDYDNAKTALTAATIIDGTVTLKVAMECVLAFVGGRATVTDNGATRTITFYHRDGTTPILRLVVSETDGSRATGGTIDP